MEQERRLPEEAMLNPVVKLHRIGMYTRLLNSYILAYLNWQFIVVGNTLNLLNECLALGAVSGRQ